MHDAFPDLLRIGGPRGEAAWVFLTAPDLAGVDAALQRAAALPGARDARVLLVKAMIDCGRSRKR